MKIDGYKLWTALVTPLTPGLQIDFPALKNLIKEQVEAKNGILILGSTGEALNLSLEDKKSIVNFVTELNPVSPVMVGVGGHDLSAQKEWINWLEKKQNIQAYLMVTPIYAKPNSEGQYRWFKELMDLSSKPVMLYNVPGRAGASLSLEAVRKLRTHKNFWAIKEASGSVQRFLEYLCASGNGKVFCGDDGLMNDFARAGSYGLVSVASNVWPEQTHLYVEQCLENELEAKALWNSAANSLFCVSNPIPAKALLAHEGRINSDAMMPPLCADDMRNLGSVTSFSEKINKWFNDNK